MPRHRLPRCSRLPKRDGLPAFPLEDVFRTRRGNLEATGAGAPQSIPLFICAGLLRLREEAVDAIGPEKGKSRLFETGESVKKKVPHGKATKRVGRRAVC